MRFDLHRPCSGCPFLKEGGVKFLGSDRAAEIASLFTTTGEGGTFPCHKTIDYDKPSGDEDESWGAHVEGTQHCAGALLFMEKVNPRGNNIIRIAERLGLYQRTSFVGADLVYDTVEEFTSGQAGRRDTTTNKRQEHSTTTKNSS